MEITEVRVKLVERSSERLRAFCSVTFDGDFVIRDLKVIDGVSGVFVAMPSRKLSDRCNRCGSKNHLRARFCNECGQRLNENRAPKDPDGRAKLHADIAHPINAACRERIQKEVVKAYEAELERSKSPDYQPINFDDFEDDYDDHQDHAPPAKQKVSNTEEAADEGLQQESAQDRRDRGGEHRRDRGDKKSRSDDPSKQAAGAGGGGETFGDYNELIADLKREAATRHDDRRSGHGQYGRRERQEVSSPSARSTAPREDVKKESATEEESDFGAGIGTAGRDRGKQNHRGGRESNAQETARQDDRQHRERQQTPAPAQEKKPEPPRSAPEPAPAESRPSPASEDDDFGAGLL